MPLTLKFYVDLQDKKLRSSLTSLAETQPPPLVQGEVIFVEVYPVMKTGNISAPLAILDMTGHACKMGIVSTPGVPSGRPGGPPLAAAADLTWDGQEKFTGQLSLNTTEIETLIGERDHARSVLEFRFTAPSGSVHKVLVPVAVLAEVIESEAPTPVPQTEFLTKAECLALFARLVGLPGQRQSWMSPNGRYRVTRYIDNEGIVHDDVEQIG